MKPELLKVPQTPNSSFTIRRDVVPHFYNRWHYHPEVELVYVEKGSGTRFVGERIENFTEGDLVLIGAHLPHYWRCDESYFQGNTRMMAEATVLHFPEDFLGRSFLDLPENALLRELLEKSRLGLRIGGQTREQVFLLLQELLHLSGPDRLITLLIILKTIASSNEIELLSSYPFVPHSLAEFEIHRINQIYAYTLAHATEKITLEDIARVAHLSPYSFCRYFKSRTRKTYSRFLIEVRIGMACKYLIENKLSVSQVCLESGFHNFSHFNRQFKALTGLTPLQYQHKYR
jgi:AraC-like DNA-binding protein